MKFQRTKNNRGFTLIEMLLSIAILAIVGLLTTQMVDFFYTSYRQQEAMASMQQNGRTAMDMLSREIRLSGLQPAGGLFPNSTLTLSNKVNGKSGGECSKAKTASVPITGILEASATSFYFLTDLNGDGNVSKDKDDDDDDDDDYKDYKDDNEEIRYEWVGSNGKSLCVEGKDPNTLYRDTGGGMQEVAIGITAFAFFYFNAEGTALTSLPLNLDDRGKVARVHIVLQAVAPGTTQPLPLESNVWIRNQQP